MQDPIDYEVLVDDFQPVDLRLPNNVLKKNYSFRNDRTVQQEKERILQEEKVGFQPSELVMIMNLPQGRREIMDERQNMNFYLVNVIDYIELGIAGKTENKDGRTSKPKDFNYQLKN